MAKNPETSPAKAETGESQPVTDRPWAPFQSLRDEIEDLFDDFYPETALAPLRRMRWPRRVPTASGIAAGARMIKLDVIDKEDELKLIAELPGMEEKDIDVKVTDQMLTLSGEKKVETEEGDKDSDYYLCERRFGSFRRTVRIPDGIDQDKIDATFKNGVLTVHLPKKPEAQHPSRKIEVKAVS